MLVLSSHDPNPWQNEIVPEGRECNLALEWDFGLTHQGKGACGPLPWSPTW